ncbi:MAG TPA: SIMPL domain-containing protein [Micromonosporaceae bacterium]
MIDGPVVAVRGEVVREVPPELAVFSVTVLARDKERRAVLDRLTERAAAVRDLVDSYGDAVERRETGSLYVRPELKRAGERVSAYHGQVTVTVTVTDFTVLAELMLRLADQDQVNVSGPWWQLRPDSPVHREARRAAIAAAVQRAREYADAIGARVTGLLQVTDVGMADQPMTLLGTARMEMGGGPPQLDLDPQQQTVRAGVEARFTISQPTILADGSHPGPTSADPGLSH